MGLGAAQTRKLVLDLQKIAKDAGHERPLLIGIDQENGEQLVGFGVRCADWLIQGIQVWYRRLARLLLGLFCKF